MVRCDFAALLYNNDFNYKARALKLVTVNVPITANYSLEHSMNFAQILTTAGKRTRWSGSPTIFFIMKELFATKAAGRVVAMAFGPGLTIELALLEVDRAQ